MGYTTVYIGKENGKERVKLKAWKGKKYTKSETGTEGKKGKEEKVRQRQRREFKRGKSETETEERIKKKKT